MAQQSWEFCPRERNFVSDLFYHMPSCNIMNFHLSVNYYGTTFDSIGRCCWQEHILVWYKITSVEVSRLKIQERQT